MSFRPDPRGELLIGANNRAPAVMGRLKPGVSLDQANAEFIALARHLAEDNPKTNQNFDFRECAAAAERVYWRAVAAKGLGDAGSGDSRFADRVRERNEHAVRARPHCARKNWRFAARSAQRVGDSCARC